MKITEFRKNRIKKKIKKKIKRERMKLDNGNQYQSLQTEVLLRTLRDVNHPIVDCIEYIVYRGRSTS